MAQIQTDTAGMTLVEAGVVNQNQRGGPSQKFLEKLGKLGVAVAFAATMFSPAAMNHAQAHQQPIVGQQAQQTIVFAQHEKDEGAGAEIAKNYMDVVQKKQAIIQVLEQTDAQKALGKEYEPFKEKIQNLDTNYAKFVQSAWKIANGERASVNLFERSLIDQINMRRIRSSGNPFKEFVKEFEEKNIQKEFINGTIMKEMAGLFAGRWPHKQKDWPIVQFVLKTFPDAIQQNKEIGVDVSAEKAEKLTLQMQRSLQPVDFFTPYAELETARMKRFGEYLVHSNYIDNIYSQKHQGVPEKTADYENGLDKIKNLFKTSSNQPMTLQKDQQLGTPTQEYRSPSM